MELGTLFKDGYSFVLFQASEWSQFLAFVIDKTQEQDWGKSGSLDERIIDFKSNKSGNLLHC